MKDSVAKTAELIGEYFYQAERRRDVSRETPTVVKSSEKDISAHKRASKSEKDLQGFKR
jgi:hypothetical protein